MSVFTSVHLYTHFENIFATPSYPCPCMPSNGFPWSQKNLTIVSSITCPIIVKLEKTKEFLADSFILGNKLHTESTIFLIVVGDHISENGIKFSFLHPIYDVSQYHVLCQHFNNLVLRVM